jgi:hypothetical protein
MEPAMIDGSSTLPPTDRTRRLCRTLATLLGALTLGLAGCASDSDAVQKRLSDLQGDLRKLQNDTDRVNERLEAVEIRQARADAAANAPKATSAETVSRPRLKVLRLAPGDDAAAGEAKKEQPEDGPRMMLKGQGKELELKQSPGSSTRTKAREKPLAMAQDRSTASPSGVD